jgi:hypothetical protein
MIDARHNERRDRAQERDASATPARRDTAVAALARRHIEDLMRERGATMDRVARTLGIDPVTVLQIRRGDRGVGPKVERAFANVFYKGSVDSLREAAATTAELGTQPVTAPVELVESTTTPRGGRSKDVDDEYPARALALLILGDAIYPRIAKSLKVPVFPPGVAERMTTEEWIALAEERQERAKQIEARAKMPPTDVAAAEPWAADKPATGRKAAVRARLAEAGAPTLSGRPRGSVRKA